MAEFKVNGKTYSIPEDPDLGEMCAAEEAFDKDFGRHTLSTMKMLIWIAVRRGGDEMAPEEIDALKASIFAELGDVSPPAERPAALSSISGGSSEPASDTPDDPSISGSPGSDTGSDSAQATFFTALRAS